jgi:hypothetical protein
LQYEPKTSRMAFAKTKIGELVWIGCFPTNPHKARFYLSDGMDGNSDSVSFEINVNTATIAAEIGVADEEDDLNWVDKVRAFYSDNKSSLEKQAVENAKKAAATALIIEEIEMEPGEMKGVILKSFEDYKVIVQEHHWDQIPELLRQKYHLPTKPSIKEVKKVKQQSRLLTRAVNKTPAWRNLVQVARMASFQTSNGGHGSDIQPDESLKRKRNNHDDEDDHCDQNNSLNIGKEMFKKKARTLEDVD